MDKLKDKPTPPHETQPAPQAPMQSPSASPYGSKILLIPLIIAILVVLLGVGYLVGAKVFFPKTPPVSPQITPYPTPTPDPTENWKTYKSDKWDIEFNYPADFEILIDANNHLLIAKDQLGSDGISIVSDKDADYIAVNSLRSCSVANEEINRNSGDRQSCLDVGNRFGQSKDIETIKLGGNDVRSFYETSLGRGGTRHVLQTTNKPFIQLTSTDPNEIVFDQILSTFRFLETTPSPEQEKFCDQVITPAKNPRTGECRDFPTPCDVPEGWEKVGSCR